MPAQHLPQPVQDALRMEVLSTALCFDNIIVNRQPSQAATLLALVGQFVVETGMKRADCLAAFERAYDTFMAMTATITQVDLDQAVAYAADPESLPPNASDVLLGLRGAAVRGATSLHEER